MSVNNNFLSNQYWHSTVNAIVDRLNKNKPEEAFQIFERTALSPTTPQIAPEIINEISTRLYANRSNQLKTREICEYVQKALPGFELTALVEGPRQTQTNLQSSWIVEPQKSLHEPIGMQAFFDPEALPKPKAERPAQPSSPTRYQGRPTALKIRDIRKEHGQTRAQGILNKMLLQGRIGTFDSPSLGDAVFKPIKVDEVSPEFMTEDEQLAHALRLSQQEADNSQPA